MRTRALGRSGLQVSEIGFGAWGLGGDRGGSVAYGPADAAQSVAALRRAHELGVNFFDTSDFYGFGASEELIGETLGALRGPLFASKAGMLDATRQDFSAEHLRRALESSLRRLRRSALDLYQLHSPPVELIAARGPIDELARMKAEGLIRAIGVSVRSPQDGLAATRRPEVDCIQVNFNLLDQRARENGLFERCAECGVGVIARTPLCFGFLTGKYAADAPFGAQDHRAKWSVDQRKLWASGQALFAAWRGNASDTPAQFALRYCLSFAAISSVIPGMLEPAHVEENASASAAGPLPTATLAAIGETYARHSFFVESERKDPS